MITRPSDLFASRTPLEGLRVGISGAIPERELWGDVADLDRLILTFVGQLSALVIRYGGRVVHGSQPLLSPIVAEQARLQSRDRAGALTLIASQVFGEIPEVTLSCAEAAQASMILTTKQGDGTARDPETRNKSLTAMRLALMPEIDVLVAIGGKLQIDTGFNPGVLEELAMSRWHGLPTFIVGCFGGAAGEIERTLVKELSGPNLLASLEMAEWTGNMDDYVGKLLSHFLQHQERFRNTRRFEHRFSPFQAMELPEYNTSVVTVDPKVVDAWASRFADFRKAAEQKDVKATRGMLRGEPEVA